MCFHPYNEKRRKREQERSKDRQSYAHHNKIIHSKHTYINQNQLLYSIVNISLLFVRLVSVVSVELFSSLLLSSSTSSSFLLRSYFLLGLYVQHKANANAKSLFQNWFVAVAVVAVTAFVFFYCDSISILFGCVNTIHTQQVWYVCSITVPITTFERMSAV